MLYALAAWKWPNTDSSVSNNPLERKYRTIAATGDIALGVAVCAAGAFVLLSLLFQNSAPGVLKQAFQATAQKISIPWYAAAAIATLGGAYAAGSALWLCLVSCCSGPPGTQYKRMNWSAMPLESDIM